MIVFDIETDGFIENMTEIHCIATHDRESGTKHVFNSQSEGGIVNGLEYLMEESRAGIELGGHYVSGFDIPAIQKLYPWFKPDVNLIRDSKVESEMWYPASTLKTKDFAAAKRKRGKWIDAYLFGRHSLAAWGARIGCPKDEYSARCKEKGIDPWAAWNQDMEDYCVQDVETNVKLFEFFEARFDYDATKVAVWIENRVSPILIRQTQWGVQLNVKKAGQLHAKLAGKQAAIEAELREKYFSPFYLRSGGAVTPKKTLNYKDKLRPDLTAGAQYTKVKNVEFNAGSRQHIYKRLMTLYGWKPTVLTPAGDPQVDEKVLSGLDYPPCKLLLEYLLLDKRIGQVADGNNAWLKKEKNGRIYGAVKQNGTRTTRASHVSPNLGQVPKVGKPYGKDCRELFEASPGRVIMGVDLSGIEMRAQGHYLARFDGGSFARTVVDGDVHELVRIALGFNSRDITKTFEYASTYGAGMPKLGSIVYSDMTPEQQAKQKTGVQALGRLGKQRKDMFAQNIKGMTQLLDAVSKAADRGFMRALDGRKLDCPSAHSALNTLYQHLGGLVAKVWMILFNDMLVEQGLIPADTWYIDPANHGVWECVQMLWVHDELQNDCLPEVAELCGKLAQQAAKDAGEFFKLHVPIDAEFKIGKNWSETH